MTSHNETGRAPRDVIEAMLGYLETSTGSADLEFGIAGEDYRVVWDSVDSAGVIVATVYDITDPATPVLVDGAVWEAPGGYDHFRSRR